MATPPDFTAGAVLTANQMDSVGLWLVESQAVGSGVSSITVTDAFSADYDNYLITYTGGTSVDGNIQMRLDSATTGYFGSLVYGNYAANTVTGFGQNNGNEWSFAGGGGTYGTCFIQVFQPFLETNTEMFARIRYATVYGTYNGHRGDNASYTDFTLIAGSGTFTGGTCRVYGYRN
jgi:hypothetical protein